MKRGQKNFFGLPFPLETLIMIKSPLTTVYLPIKIRCRVLKINCDNNSISIFLLADPSSMIKAFFVLSLV